jgi:hypothetical protein
MDSALEGTGFEPSVPRGDRLRFHLADAHRVPRHVGLAAMPGHLDPVCVTRRCSDEVAILAAHPIASFGSAMRLHRRRAARPAPPPPSPPPDPEDPVDPHSPDEAAIFSTFAAVPS